MTREATTSEVAARIGCKVDNLRKWKTRGLLPLAPKGRKSPGRGNECYWSDEAIEQARALFLKPIAERQGRK